MRRPHSLLVYFHRLHVKHVERRTRLGVAMARAGFLEA